MADEQPGFGNRDERAALRARSGYGALAEAIWNDPELASVLKSYGVGGSNPRGNNWMADLMQQHPEMSQSFDTPEQAKAAAKAIADKIDPRSFTAIVDSGAKSWQKDWEDGQHDNSFFGMNPDTVAGGMLLASGGSLLAGAGGATAASTKAASGLAGQLGMNAGYGATALNSGALNAGMTLARGGNISDALQAGATGAVLAPIAGMTSNAVGGGITGALAGGAAQGGVGAALNGKDISTGIRNGTVNAGVGMIGNAAGNYAGGIAKDAGLESISKNIGSAVSAGTRAAVTGKDVGSALAGNLASQGMNALSSKDNSLMSGFNGGIDTKDLTPNAFDAPYNKADWEDTSSDTQGANMPGYADEEEDQSDAFWSTLTNKNESDEGGSYSVGVDDFGDVWSPMVAQDSTSMDQEIAGRQGQVGNLDGTGTSTDWFGSILKGLGLGASTAGSAIKSVGSWLGAKENSDFARVLLSGVSSALSNNSAEARQKLQNQGAIDILDHKEKLKREEEKRYNDSWLNPPQATGMLSAPRPLTRLDGTRVYGTGAGMIDRG